MRLVKNLLPRSEGTSFATTGHYFSVGLHHGPCNGHRCGELVFVDEVVGQA